jgi:hypothetical protein
MALIGNKNRLTHGMAHSPEHKAYFDAKGRCTNPKHRLWKWYGGRGIEFLFTSFVEFINHLGLKPSPELELDRIKTDGPYEIGNVRWSTRTVNNINTRLLTVRNKSGYRGVSFDGSCWLANIGVDNKVVRLGRFDSAVAAAHAYDAAAKELHGEFAVLNFPQ